MKEQVFVKNILYNVILILITILYPGVETLFRIIWILHHLVIVYMSVRNFVSHQEKISHFKLLHSCLQLQLGNVKTKNIFTDYKSGSEREKTEEGSETNL